MGANENFWKLAQERMESHSNKKKENYHFKTQKIHCFNSWCFFLSSLFSFVFDGNQLESLNRKLHIFFVLRALRNGSFKMLLEICFGKNSPFLFATVGMRRQLIHGERQQSVQKRINQLRFASHAFVFISFLWRFEPRSHFVSKLSKGQRSHE